MELRAVPDKVIVRPDEAEPVSDGGIILATKKKALPTTGVIVSVGESQEHEMSVLTVGDRVCFKDMAGSEISWEGQTYYVLLFTELLAVLGEE